MSSSSTALVWLRRDLRLADNPALQHALSVAETVIPVYIHAPHEEAPWEPGAASLWWLHHSLGALSNDLQRLGSRLIIRSGSTPECLESLLAETGATQLYWNRLYEPAVIKRDQQIKQQLRDQSIEVQSFNSALLFEPWEITNKAGQPCKVFTPFWKTCCAQGVHRLPLPTPETLPAVDPELTSIPLAALGLLPTLDWDTGLASSWQVGEQGAHEALESFIDGAMHAYKEDRNRPDLAGTSKLSPHLHFGEISPLQVHSACMRAVAEGRYPGEDRHLLHFLSEIGWREFSYHLLYHFPQTPESPLDTRFERFPWPKTDPEQLRAWQKGQTGIPIVDAAMRELWHTGWMHNRVRMVVASLLSKNLQIHWLEGACWFWDTLVDADLANNTQGWQWTAGCGADAAPYFRIFNPVLQGERFDPHGKYVRQWVPEIAGLPDNYLQKPWEAPAEVLAAAKINLGRTYPHPILDLGETRQSALQAFSAIKQPPVAS